MLRSCNSVAILSSKIFLPKEEIMEGRCQFWLPKKRRYCANAPLYASSFCGNHTPRSDGQWIPCPVDPSHSVLDKNLRGHAKRCPLVKQIQSLSLQPYYRKGINGGRDESAEKDEEADVSSETKRSSVHNMSVTQFIELLSKIRTVHGALRKDIRDSYKMPEACNLWIKREVDRKLPYQEKHVMQQASILGNLEDFGVLKNSHHASMRGLFDFPMLRENQNDVAAVIEFGAGRGYLTQMLADCYGINEVFLVERKSYKRKADRSLRQKESLVLKRLRIDIEDLNLNAVESLRGIPYLAIGKHLCGPATDLTLRCCLPEHHERDNGLQETVCHDNRGLAIATCCHHLCQWKHYINKTYMWNIGISKEDFHAISWFTSWAVDADHGSELCYVDCESEMQSIAENKCGEDAKGVEEILRNMNALERALLGFMCKDIIDMGRLMWIKERGMEAELVKYVPSSISPENRLLVARRTNHL